MFSTGSRNSRRRWSRWGRRARQCQRRHFALAHHESMEDEGPRHHLSRRRPVSRHSQIGRGRGRTRRSATVFTSMAELQRTLPDAVPTTVPIPGDFYKFRSRRLTGRLRLVFVGDDRPRKGLVTLLEALEETGLRYELDVVGPHERHLVRLEALGARLSWLAWTRRTPRGASEVRCHCGAGHCRSTRGRLWRYWNS